MTWQIWFKNVWELLFKGTFLNPDLRIIGLLDPWVDLGKVISNSIGEQTCPSAGKPYQGEIWSKQFSNLNFIDQKTDCSLQTTLRWLARNIPPLGHDSACKHLHTVWTTRFEWRSPQRGNFIGTYHPHELKQQWRYLFLISQNNICIYKSYASIIFMGFWILCWYLCSRSSEPCELRYRLRLLGYLNNWCSPWWSPQSSLVKRRSTTHFSILLTDTLLETQFWTYSAPRLQLGRLGHQTPFPRKFDISLDFLGYLACDFCGSKNSLKVKSFSPIKFNSAIHVPGWYPTVSTFSAGKT